MSELFDLEIVHLDEHGQNDLDLWEGITAAQVADQVAWHLANCKVLSVEVYAQGYEPPPPAKFYLFDTAAAQLKPE